MDNKQTLLKILRQFDTVGRTEPLPVHTVTAIQDAVDLALAPAIISSNQSLAEVQLHLERLAFNFANRMLGRERWLERQTVERWLFELELKKSPSSTRRKRNRHYRQQERERIEQTETFIAVGLASGIFEERTQNGTVQLRFIHNLLEDYFAATYLASQPVNLPLLAELIGGGWCNFVPNRIWQFWSELEPSVIPNLLDALQFSQDSDQRRAAAIVLKYIAKPSINQLLLDRFATSARMREDVIKAIMHIDPTAIELFLLAFESEDENVRWDAVVESGILPITDERVAVALLRLAQNEAESIEIRSTAVSSLGRVADRSFVMTICALYPRAKMQGQDSLQRTVLTALRLLGGRHSLPTLLEGLRDPVQSVREHAVDGLQSATHSLGLDLDRRVMPQLVEALSDTSARVRQDAAYVLAYAKDPLALAPLLARLEIEEDLEVKETLIYSLGHFHPTQVWSVIEEYTKLSQARDLRLSAISTCRILLSKNENIQPDYIEKILSLLDAALEDEDKAVRRSVAEVLAKLPAAYHPLAARFIPPILAVALDLEVDSYYRRKTLDALGNLKPLDVALNPLLELLTVEAKRRHTEEEQHDVLFHEVLTVLVQFGHTPSVRYVYDYLKRLYDGSEWLEHPSDANELIEALGEVPNLDVDITHFLLHIMNDKGTAHQEWRYPAVIALGKLSQTQNLSEITQLLLQVLNDPAEEYRIRYAAAEVLGDLQLAEAVEPLMLALADRYLGDEAELALGRIGEAAVEALTDNLKHNPDAEVRWHSARALCRIKSKTARPVLETLIGSYPETDPDVRYFTARALELLNQAEAEGN